MQVTTLPVLEVQSVQRLSRAAPASTTGEFLECAASHRNRPSVQQQTGRVADIIL